MPPSTPHIREPAIVAQRPLSAVFPGRDLLASVCGMRPPNKRVAATVAARVAAAVAAGLSLWRPRAAGGRDQRPKEAPSDKLAPDRNDASRGSGKGDYVSRAGYSPRACTPSAGGVEGTACAPHINRRAESRLRGAHQPRNVRGRTSRTGAGRQAMNGDARRTSGVRAGPPDGGQAAPARALRGAQSAQMRIAG